MHRLLLPLLLLGLILGLTACAMKHPTRPDQDPAAGVAAGSLFSREGLPVSPTEFAVQTWGAGYFLLGEGHTSDCDHQVQAAIVETLVRFGVRPSVGLEMVDVTRQGILDRFNMGELAVDELPKALEWNSTWGYDFDLYRPIFETARRLDLPVRALNLPKRVIDAVKTEAASDLNATDAALVPEEIIPPKKEQQEALAVQFRQHRSLFSPSNDSSLERFFLVQSLWDTQMAIEAAAARRELDRPVAVIVGSGHVEYEWGIAHRLAVIDPETRVVSVVPWRGMSEPDRDAGQYYFYCPMTHASRLGYTLTVTFETIEVTAVKQNSKAAAAGLEVGDVLKKAGDAALTGLWQLHQEAILARRDGRPLTLTVDRNGEPVVVRFDVEQNEEETPGDM